MANAGSRSHSIDRLPKKRSQITDPEARLKQLLLACLVIVIVYYKTPIAVAVVERRTDRVAKCTTCNL